MAKPANCISETEARTLYNNWDNRATLINNNLAPDARDVIFSVEELEAYLKASEKPVLDYFSPEEFAEPYTEFYTTEVLN